MEKIKIENGIYHLTNQNLHHQDMSLELAYSICLTRAFHSC